jgi:hypothetical protein
MMNNHVITPLTISDLSSLDLKFFTRLGVLSPSAVETWEDPEPRRCLNGNRVLGMITVLGVSAAGWTAVAFGVARLLR